MRKIIKISGRILLGLILLILALYGILHFSWVQTKIVQKISANLSENLHARVSIKRVDFSFFNKLELEQLYIEDRNKDTLLYAGTAEISLNDWFFFSDEIHLHYIGLNDGFVHLNRKDSVWNYAFLVDYLTPPPSQKPTKQRFSIQPERIQLQNIKILQQDGWIGTDMSFGVKKMDLSFDQFDADKKKIHISALRMTGPSFHQNDYDGNRPANYPRRISPPSKLPYQWNNERWMVDMDLLQLMDGKLQIDHATDREKYADMFDGQHILFDNLSGEVSHLHFSEDTAIAQIKLRGKERSGLEVKRLDANLKFTPEEMTFSNLDIVTNKSHLRNYYSMRYQSFNDDMNDFLSKVTLQGNFTNSELSSDDLAYFDLTLKKWKRNFTFSGNILGTIENISGKNMKVQTGNSSMEGDIRLTGLPDIDSTYIDLNSRALKTNYNELITLVPALHNGKGVSWSKIGNLEFIGQFAGYLNDFRINGAVSTNLGSVSTNLTMKLPASEQPKYSGTVLTNGFELGTLINNDRLGLVALNGKISGRGFDVETIDADFDGNIEKLEFGGYTYTNMVANGNFTKNIFTGQMTMNDPHIRINSMEGMLNLSKKDIAFNLQADVEYMHLKELKLWNRDLSLTGSLQLNFKGNNIDNFSGTGKVFNARLVNENTNISFDSLHLQSREENGIKHLSLQSDDIDADITGEFQIKELPGSFRAFLSKYYPGYIQAPDSGISQQQFAFKLKTREFENYWKLLNPKLSGMDYSDISGRLDMEANKFQLKATVPSFSYGKNYFSDIRINSIGDRDSLHSEISVDDIAVTDSLHFPGTRLQVSASNDISLIHLTTSASEAINEAELNATLHTMEDSIRILFAPSSFIINNKKWELENAGELSIGAQQIDVKDIKFKEGYQEVSLTSDKDPMNGEPMLTATLEEVIVEDFVPYFLKEPKLKGLLTGTATIKDPLGKAIINFTGTSKDLYLENNLVGDLSLQADANLGTGRIGFAGKADNEAYGFQASGYYNYLDTTGNNLLAELSGERVNLKVLEPYLGAVFNSIEGNAKSNLRLVNEDDNTYLTGTVKIDSAALTVDYTKCKYLIKNETLRFNKDEIELSNIKLSDTLGQTGLLNGKISHKFFDNFAFSKIRLETPRMLLLNTGKKDNPDFYGNITGSAIMTLNGPLTGMKMTIDGQPGILDSSHIYISAADSKESNDIDYIDFVEFGSETNPMLWRNKNTDISVELNIIANPACKVDVILDEATGDIIKGSGNGAISIRAGTNEDLSVRGRYELTSGEYTFNFQTFFKKPFELSRGTLTWNGDPYEAIIDVSAAYTAKNVNVSTIVPQGGFKQKEDIIILSHLTGNLSKPEIKFEFQLPEKSELNRDYITIKKLADLQKDETEMNKQVASLLLFNTFITENQNFFSGQNTTAFVTSTIGGMISNWLTNVFNKELEKATNGMLSTYIDINPTLSLQKDANELQANVRAGLKLLLSNRIVFLVGGNLEYNNPYIQYQQRKGLLTPDLTLEWLLNKEGSIRVVGFHRSSIDYSMGLRNRTGAQLSFRKDFDHPGDLLKSRKRIEEDRIREESKQN